MTSLMETQTTTLSSNQEIRVKQEYKDLSTPKDAGSYAILERDCLQRGIIQPLIIDEDGNILDGMHRYEIAERHNLSYTCKVQTFPSEEAKKQWICLQSMLQKHYTKIQRNLCRYRMMLLEKGTVQERASRLAEQFPEPLVKKATTVARYKTCWFYGEKLVHGDLIPGIYHFAISGGSVLLRDLNELSKLSRKEQGIALRERQESSRPWRDCIREARHQCVSASRGCLLDDVSLAKRSLGSLNRYVSELKDSTHKDDQALIKMLGGSVDAFAKTLPAVYKLLAKVEKQLK